MSAKDILEELYERGKHSSLGIYPKDEVAGEALTSLEAELLAVLPEKKTGFVKYSPAQDKLEAARREGFNHAVEQIEAAIKSYFRGES